MNSIFKIKNGTYVDLSRIVAIDFNTLRSNSFSVEICINIFFEKNYNDLLFKNENTDVGVLRIYEVYGVEQSSQMYDLLVGSFNDDLTRDRTTIDIPKALELAKNKIIEKYKHLIDAWENYKNDT